MTIHRNTRSQNMAGCNRGAGASEQAAAAEVAVLGIAAVVVVLTLAVLANGQATPNTIQPVAGGGTITSDPTTADIPGPVAVVEDSKGNVYVAPPAADYIFELTSADQSIVFAGLGWGHYNKNPTGYNGIATQIPVYTSSGLGVDRFGDVYIADTTDNTIRRVDKSGNIMTVAGRRQPCVLQDWPSCNDGHRAIDAYLYHPQGVVFDSSNNMYVADTGDNVIRWVQAKGQIINLLAGTYGKTCGDPVGQSVCGDGGPATQALLNSPMGVSVDSQGNVYIADTVDNRIRCVAAVAGGCVSGSQAGYIYTVAGTGTACTAGNDGQNSKPPYCGDGAPATQANIGSPRGVSVAASGEYYITETRENRIRVVSSGTISNFAGQPEHSGYSGDGGPATEATLMTPNGVYVDKAGNVFIADTGNQRIRKVSASTGNIDTILGSADNGPAGSGGDFSGATGMYAMLAGPYQVTVDSSNNFYIADWANNRIRVVNTQNHAITIANVTIQAGDIATVAGNGDFGSSGDNGSATSATLEDPYGVAVDNSGNIYIADTGSARIRVVNGATGIITTVSGTKGPLVKPVTVAVDTQGHLFIADEVAQEIFEENGGTVTVVAGTGSTCPSPTEPCGDGGPATEAMLNGPTGIAVASNGDFYIADSNDNRVRCVLGAAKGCGGSTLNPGDIVGYAYKGGQGFSGDGGPAIKAGRWAPKQVALDANWNLFIGGGQCDVVQRVDYATATLITVAGVADKQPNYFGYTGDGGPATLAELNNMGLVIDSNENLLIADLNNNRVRAVGPLVAVVSLTPSSLNFGDVPVGKKSQPQTVTLENIGANDLSISQITIGGNDPGDFSETNTCPSAPIPPLAKSKSACKIKVTFAPKQQGERDAVLTITDNGFESPQQVTLTGTGTQ